MPLFKEGEIMLLNVENKAIPFGEADLIQDVGVSFYSSNPKEMTEGNLLYYFNRLVQARNTPYENKTDKTIDGKLIDYNKVKLLFIDSSTEMFELMLSYHKRIYTGKDIRHVYGNFQDEVKTFWNKSNAFQLPKIYTALPKEIQDETGIIERRADVPGQALSGKFETRFTIALFCLPDRYAKTPKERYRFLTNTTQGYCAKSPMNMFDSDYIPNDLGYVYERVLKLYKKDLNSSYRFPDILITGASGSGKTTSLRSLVCSQ